MSAPVRECQPVCETPPGDLLRLADVVDDARLLYLDAYMLGLEDMDAKEDALRQVLWDDKGTWGPALRQAATAPFLKARVEELTKALEQIRIVAVDNSATTVRHDLALEFVGGIAARAVALPLEDQK